MSALTLTLKAAVHGALDLSPLTPAVLADLGPTALARLPLAHGGRQSCLADLFDISGEDAQQLRLRRLDASCHHVGRGMRGGVIEISGNVGVGLGSEMHGGEIILRGSAGDGVGLGMRGGVIRVRGDAGDRVGGMLPGQTRGMNGGAILIDGNAGAQLGERMRRGLVVVGGDCGTYCGDRMIAGTIAVFGQCGAHLGAGMRRGSVLLATRPGSLPSGFNACGTFELAIVPIFAAHLGNLDRRYARAIAPFVRAERWCGDLAHGGKGELLIAAAS